MTLNQIDGGRWEDCFRGLVLDKKKCCDQKTSGGRKQCKADGNQGMCGVDGKEHRAVGDQTDTVGRGHSEICKQGKVVCKSHLPSWFVRPCCRCQRLLHKTVPDAETSQEDLPLRQGRLGEDQGSSIRHIGESFYAVQSRRGRWHPMEHVQRRSNRHLVPWLGGRLRSDEEEEETLQASQENRRLD